MEVFDSIENSIVECTEELEVQKLKKIIKLSLVPKCEYKFTIIDVIKNCEIELRALPPIEVYILLPESYPSNSGPLFMIPKTTYSNALFYEQMRSFLYERLNEKWNEDSNVLYECVLYI